MTEQSVRSKSIASPIGWFFHKILFFFAITGPDLLLAGGMTILLVSTVWAVGGHVRFLQASLGFPIGIMLALILYRTFLKGRNPNYQPRIALILRDWLPFLLITFIYENLHDLSKFFYAHDIAGALMNWDIAIFVIRHIFKTYV